jgi:hypothetical protein
MKKIPFSDFLKRAKENEFWNNVTFYGFLGESYPVLFFNFLYSFLNSKKIVAFDIAQRGAVKEILPSLQQQFLGEKKFYWLGDQVEQVAKKNKKELITFLSVYKGPNVISSFFSEEAVSKGFDEEKACFILLDTVLNYESFLALIDFFERDYSTKKKAQLKLFFDGSEGLSLDLSCMLLNYIDVAGMRTKKDVEHYVNILNPFSGSLFSLSQYFFARDSKRFFSLWSKMAASYPDIFWISYWSDQLWRAHNVVTLLTCGKNREARRFSFRLPYAFSNKDWKKSSAFELLNAYHFLFKADYGLKRGWSFCSLDLFFSKYFGGAF